MIYILIIVVAIILSISYYLYKKNMKNKKTNFENNDEESLLNTNHNSNNKTLIKIKQLPITSIEKHELLSEIKDSKILAHINNLVPNLMQATTLANNAIQATSNVVYQAIIPADAILSNSRSMKGAFRGIYHGDKGIRGHANLVEVNQSTQAVTNTISAGVSITSMIVGQYYMTQINSELAKINDEISKISTFQDSEYKSKILALIIQIKRISTFQIEILESKQLRDLDIDKLNTLEHNCIELLGQANLMIKELIKKEDINYEKYEQALVELQNWTNYQKILLKILSKITELKNILYLGTISKEQLNMILNTYTKQVVDVHNSLILWHKNIAETLGINIGTARRKRKGFDGAIHWIPGLFKDDYNFSTLSEQTKTMIEEQTLDYNINTEYNITDCFNKDVKIISKEGKIYYLPE